MKKWYIKCESRTVYSATIEAETAEEAQAIADTFPFCDEHASDRMWEDAEVVDEVIEEEE